VTAPTPTRLVIATRASQLALAQARDIQMRLQTLYPACAVELLELTTRGDRILDRSLAKIGGKGLFVKELQTALLDGRADLAVHSLKDVPVELASDFALAAITARLDARDAFISPRYATLADLPAGAIVGTSSLRREAQLRERRPDLVVRPLRGNVNTRLAKLDAGDYDAIVLAAAGLQRLGLTARIRDYLSVDDSLPAADWATVLPALARQALDGLLDARAREGAHLAAMLRERCTALRQLAAQAAGQPLSAVPADVLEETWNNYQPGTRRPYGVMEWPALLRKLDRLDPSYRD